MNRRSFLTTAGASVFAATVSSAPVAGGPWTQVTEPLAQKLQSADEHQPIDFMGEKDGRRRLESPWPPAVRGRRSRRQIALISA